MLHDVIEDTSITFEDLIEQGIPETIIKTLRILTHDSTVLYMDYIQDIKNSGDRIAVTVKLADLYHNSDITRTDNKDEKTISRINKYKEAIKLLKSN